MKSNGKILSLILALALIFSAAPLTALAENDLSVGTSLGTSGHITAFAELDDDLRWQRDYTPKLPETLEATLNGGPAQIPVTWEAEGYSAAAYNAPGLYIFYAKPVEGFTVAEGVTAPKITYMQLSMMRMAGVGSDTNPLQITRADQLAEIAGLVNEGLLEQIVSGSTSNSVY